MASEIRAILFTDLIGSTEAAERAGHRAYERFRHQHFAAMREAIAAHHGVEVKTVGDAFMAAFEGAGDAVACGVAMQRAQARLNRRGVSAGLRVGISAGDVTKEGGDYFGMPVVEASRLCAAAGGGQVLVSDVVRLLDRSGEHAFEPAGLFELKGISGPVAASQVTYRLGEDALGIAGTPFVGRSEQMATLTSMLERARSGHGGVVLVIGEPGIGKTRLVEEFSGVATARGSEVVRGACYEGGWGPPYGPFVEALTALVQSSPPDQLRSDLGYGAAPLGRVVPAIRESLPDVGEPVPLSPGEEQFRTLDSASQFLGARSGRRPVVLVLDDLHWADSSTVSMLQHVARAAAKQALLVIGAYRDAELDRQHPLASALPQIRREANSERMPLRGLAPGEVGELLGLIAEHDVDTELIDAVSAETDGNPLFVREILIHLVEEGMLKYRDGRWTSEVPVSQMNIPEGIRLVVGRRLSRLSEDANRLLATASAFGGPFRFAVTASAAGLDEMPALDAIDEALDAQLIRPAAARDQYEFTHALIRHTVYSEMNPSRQVRLHRQLAEQLAAALGPRALDSAAEIAHQYRLSAALPGSERGAEFALAAAGQAGDGAAYEEQSSLLRLALELMPDDDRRRPRTAGDLGLCLGRSMRGEEALSWVDRAISLIGKSESNEAATRYAAEAASELSAIGLSVEAQQVAVTGLRLAGERRDRSWARLAYMDEFRIQEQSDDYLGVVLPTPRLEEALKILAMPSQPRDRSEILGPLPRSREEAVRAIESRWGNRGGTALMYAGDYHLAVSLCAADASEHERSGRVAAAVLQRAFGARGSIALGRFSDACAELSQARPLAERLPPGAMAPFQLGLSELFLHSSEGTEFDPLILREDVKWRLRFGATRDNQNVWAATQAWAARALAILGERETALAHLREALPAIERAPGWAPNYPLMTARVAEALWVLGADDHASTVERNVKAKVLAPDLRADWTDARLTLARLCAVQGRFGEAREWFAKARAVLEEQDARPLRAVVDFDEAWALLRQGRTRVGETASSSTVRDEAEGLLDQAVAQFEAIGMAGWVPRAESLRAGKLP